MSTCESWPITMLLLGILQVLQWNSAVRAKHKEARRGEGEWLREFLPLHFPSTTAPESCLDSVYSQSQKFDELLVGKLFEYFVTTSLSVLCSILYGQMDVNFKVKTFMLPGSA